MRIISVLVASLVSVVPLAAQEIAVSIPASATAALDSAMPGIARAALVRYTESDPDTRLNTMFRLQMVAGDQRGALSTLHQLRELRRARDPVFAPAEYSQYEVFARARLRSPHAAARELATAIAAQFRRLDQSHSDVTAHRVAAAYVFDLDLAKVQLERALANHAGATSLSVAEAVALCRLYHVWNVYRALLPVAPAMIRESQRRRYAIEESASVPLRNGNTLSAVVVRPRRLIGRQPTVLEFTVYANEQNRATALEAAAHGYVGVVATTRGKRASHGPPIPWEHDADDAQDLLTWVSRQPWSNGKVGMIGASYAGFTQWAAAKFRHPALATIVPTVAVAPGIDFPRENGVVLNFQYRWAHYVGSGPLLDDRSYSDHARWETLDSTWFARGTAYRTLDSIDGTPNPLFRTWLDHPTYDAYWQRMIPTAQEFARLDIPVLTITGYFDGAQPGALHYFAQHLSHRPSANHTLLIGPWDHFGAQRRPRAVLGDLRIDPVANVDIGAMIFAWLDYTLRGAPRPPLLANRVNFQVVGTNRWRHASSLAGMSDDSLVFSPSAEPSSLAAGADRRLVPVTGVAVDARAGSGAPRARLSVDFTDRRVISSSFISLAADTLIDRANAVVFTTDPLEQDLVVSGQFAGTLEFSANVRDVDLAVELHEHTARGEYQQLTYSLSRASLARDPSQRQLLVPGAAEQIPVRGARITSRVVRAGSRLVVVVKVNKNAESQLNYGSGKDPSSETIADATSPLEIVLLSGTRFVVPILR